MNNPTGPDATHLVEVVTTYVEMLTPDMLVPSPATDLDIIEAELPCPELNRFLYAAVGGHWYWVDRWWRTTNGLITSIAIRCTRVLVTCVVRRPGISRQNCKPAQRRNPVIWFTTAVSGRGYGGDLSTRRSASPGELWSRAGVAAHV